MRVLASFAISVNASRFSNSTPRNPISRRLRIFCCINKLLLQPKYGNFYSPIQQHTDCRFSFFTSSVQVHRTGNFPNLTLPIVSHPIPHSHPTYCNFCACTQQSQLMKSSQKNSSVCILPRSQ